MDLGALIAIILYLALGFLGLVILWWTIRLAVRRAMRDHQLWLEARSRDTSGSAAK